MIWDGGLAMELDIEVRNQLWSLGFKLIIWLQSLILSKIFGSRACIEVGYFTLDPSIGEQHLVMELGFEVVHLDVELGIEVGHKR